VRKGMALRRARRLCRDARILPPHTARYEQAMTSLLCQALPFSPLIEPGEKLVAKIASRLVKPLGEYIVAPGDEASFLAPLPVWLVPGIENRDLIRLREFNLTTVQQVTALTRMHLETGFGRRAGFIANALRGIDPAPVLPVGERPPRVMLNHAFGTDTNRPAVVEGALYRLVEQAGRRLRKQGRAARRAHIVVDYSDGRRCARQVRIEPATANDLTLFPFAKRALNLAWHRRVRIRHLRLLFDRLVFPPAQMPLFEEEDQTTTRQKNIVAAIDNIRDRFGFQSVAIGLGPVQSSAFKGMAMNGDA